MTLTSRRTLAALLALVLVAAAALLAPSAEAAKKKKPKKPRYTVSASASASQVRTSHSFTLSGSVRPKAPRKPVTVQQRVGSGWQKVATTRLTKASTFSVRLDAGKTAGTVQYRVVKPKGVQKRKVKGGKKRVKVRKGVSPTVTVKVVTWGTVKAWGENYYGQLGDGSTDDSHTPVDVKGLTEVVQVSSNHDGQTAYAVRKDGTVWAWGYNSDGQVGDGTTDGPVTTPVQVKGLPKIVQVAAMDEAAAALAADGSVWTWGANDYGQLGVPKATSRRPTPAKVQGVSRVKQLAANQDGVFALTADGAVWGWGYGGYGNLGQGADDSDSTVPVKVKGLPAGVRQIAANLESVYALAPDGRVWSWGYNGESQLGRNGTSNSGVPGLVEGLTNVKSIHHGAETSAFAVKTDGSVWAWGEGGDGQLGDGHYDESSTPVEVLNIQDPRSISGSCYSVLAATRDGRAWAWGGYGLLGRVAHEAISVPARITSLSGVTQVAAGCYTAYALVG